MTRKSDDIILSNVYHETMFEAIKARDKISVGEAIRHDLENGARVVMGLLENHDWTSDVPVLKTGSDS